MVWIPWLLGLIVVFIHQQGIEEIDFFYQTQYGISVHCPEAYAIYYAVVFLVLGLSLAIGHRSFCHHLCWMAPFMIAGRKLRNIVKWPLLKLKASQDKCTHCNTCVKNYPMSLDVNKMVHSESMENWRVFYVGPV